MKKLHIVLLSCIIITSVFGQEKKDSTDLTNDSLNSVYLSTLQSKLAQINEQRVRDSAKRADLETQLSLLKLTDHAQKEKLQKQLDDLNEKSEERIREKKAKIDALKKTARSYPVMGLFDDTLLVLYNKIGSLSANERAVLITERINKLSDDIRFKANSLQLIDAETTVDIVYGEAIIMSVSEDDAIWNDTNKEELAETYKQKITDDVLIYQKETSLVTILKQVGSALLVIALLSIVLFYIGKLFKWTAVLISLQEGKRFNGVKIRNYSILDAPRHVRIVLSINTLVKWTLIILLVYIALPIIFGFFPWTETVAQTLFGYVTNPIKKMGKGLWNYLPNLFTIAVIFMVFRYLIKGFRFLKNEVEEGKLNLPGFYPDWANPTFQILRVILNAFMFVLIFPYLPGSNSPVFQGVSVFLGFLFTFGSAGSLSNIIAGIVLTYMRLFKIGDRVKIGEVFGDVVEKSLLVTRIKTIKNEIISIPNSTVMNSHTINYSNESDSGAGLIIHTTITIGYDVPWKDIYQALLNAADRTPLLLKDPKPFVLQTSLDDFYVSYQINAYTKNANKQAIIYSDLHQHIQDCCNELGIEILSPHYRAARDGNATTIPSDYLDKNYEAPAFKVKVEK